MSERAKLTPAMRAALENVRDLGPLRYHPYGGACRKSAYGLHDHRAWGVTLGTLEALARRELLSDTPVSPEPTREFDVTPAGRALLADLELRDAAPRTAAALHDALEATASEGGR